MPKNWHTFRELSIPRPSLARYKEKMFATKGAKRENRYARMRGEDFL
jgi:hypothetical protein